MGCTDPATPALWNSAESPFTRISGSTQLSNALPSTDWYVYATDCSYAVSRKNRLRFSDVWLFNSLLAKHTQFDLPHTDVSATTLNINLNLPEEIVIGSNVDFYDRRSAGKMKGLTFTSSSAMLHRGQVVHAAQPITSGQRTNIVLWLFGEQGRIPSQRAKRIGTELSRHWTVTTTAQDHYAPFQWKIYDLIKLSG